MTFISLYSKGKKSQFLYKNLNVTNKNSKMLFGHFGPRNRNAQIQTTQTSKTTLVPLGSRAHCHFEKFVKFQKYIRKNVNFESIFEEIVNFESIFENFEKIVNGR